MIMNVKERDVETSIEKIMKKLGWIDDITSKQRNVYKQQAKTTIQNKKLQRKMPDYVLYKEDTEMPLIVLEIKRPGKDLRQALEQGSNYAKAINAPIVIVTDGVFFKTRFIENGLPLIINGEEVEELISHKRAIEFVDNNSNIINTRSSKVIASRSDLINIFEDANNLLRSEGIQAGLPRFSEFVNILFLKLISELAELNEKPHKSIPQKYRWSYFCGYTGSILLDYINDTVLEYYRNKYNEESLFEKLTISNPKTLESIINALNDLELVDINADIKGDAFEHFLKSYASGENDLGQYFTPRHIVKFMVKMLNPAFGEKVFDPFCGTGGMIIESYKHIKKTVVERPDLLEVLNNQTVYGSELTNTARITKMNMILIGDGHSNIKREDSLKNPKEGLYDVVVTNQPFAQETDFGSLYPIASKMGNSICLQHSVMATKTGGRGGLIIQEGMLFDRKYKTTRQWLFKNATVKLIISLPNGVFLPYTNAKTSIIIYEKKGTSTAPTDEIFFVDIKEDGYTLNNLREKKNVISDLDKLLEIKTDLQHASEEFLERHNIIKISYEAIRLNDFKLIGRRYLNKDVIESKHNLVELSSLCSKILRGPFGSDVKKSLYVKSGIKVYAQGNVINEDFDLGEYYITEAYFEEKLKKFEIKPKDILMTCAGTLGKIALVPECIEKGIINSVLTIFRVNTEKVLPEYFYILMKSQYIQNELLDAMGTGVKNMRPISEIKNLLVPLPTLAEQKKIIFEYEKNQKKILRKKLDLETLLKEQNDFNIFD